MKLLLLIIAFIFPAFALSFDDLRKGGFISLGSGFNLQQTDLTLINSSDQTLQEAGSSVMFRAGSGVVKKLSLFTQINQRNYFGQSQEGSYFITDIGVGGQYYFSKYIKTGFLTGSLSTAVSKFQGEDLNIGKTYQVGFGYEILSHWQVDLSWINTNSKINHTLYENLDSQSVQLTINYIWY